MFVGSGTRIRYDTKIGSNVIIGTGSVVTKDIPDNSVAAGVPARVIGSFDDYVQKMLQREKYPEELKPNRAAVDQIPITRGGENAVVASVKAGLTSPAALYDYLYGDEIEDEAEYMDKVAPTRLALDRFYIGRQTVGYDIKLIWYTVRCIIGSIVKRPQIKILEEMIDAVDGDRRALAEVGK